jgi:hypothetical protein
MWERRIFSQALAMGIDAYGCDLGDWMTSVLRDHNLLSRVFIGKFDQAHTGTVFLDEIGDMSLRTQSKILRTLRNTALRGWAERIQWKWM